MIFGLLKHWFTTFACWKSYKQVAIQFCVPLGWVEARNKRLEYLDYTIGMHYRYLMCTLVFRLRGCDGNGVYFVRSVKLYPVPGKIATESDDSYLELQDQA